MDSTEDSIHVAQMALQHTMQHALKHAHQAVRTLTLPLEHSMDSTAIARTPRALIQNSLFLLCS